MAPTDSTTFDDRNPSLAGFVTDNLRGPASAVSWGAVVAGAAAAAALSLILLLLGVGLGLSALSPWAYEGASGSTLGVSTILWITFTQIAASGMGGYLAGRLRTKWNGIQTDEVYFRDTAHGFLAWAVASLATAALLTSAIGAVIGGTVKAGSTLAAGAANVAAVASASSTTAPGNSSAAKGDTDPLGYFVDSLFRKDATAPGATVAPLPASSSAVPGGFATTPGASAATTIEVGRIFVDHIQIGALPADEVRYVGQIVAQRTGLSQQEAEKRVADTYARLQLRLREAETVARETADKARKASAYTALWLFISMLIGAFVASLAATYGGRRRDI